MRLLILWTLDSHDATLPVLGSPSYALAHSPLPGCTSPLLTHTHTHTRAVCDTNCLHYLPTPTCQVLCARFRFGLFAVVNILFMMTGGDSRTKNVIDVFDY